MSADLPRSTYSSEENEFNPRSNTEQQNSLLNPIYIFPLEENDKMILEFSKNIDQTRVFFINSNSNILERFKNLIEDEEKEFVFDDRSNAQNDNESFLTLLNESVQNIPTDKAIRWKLKVNGSSCQMLVLNNNCSKPNSRIGPLQKKLGEIIESEAIQQIINFLDVPCSNNESENAKKSQHKTNLPNQSIGEKSKKPKLDTETEVEPTTYITQEAIAEELYERIKVKLNTSKNIDLENKFEDFEFLILLPDRVSLEVQIIERIKLMFKKKDTSKINVVRICPNSAELQEKWNSFVQKARSNSETLFLVIHDECHYAAGSTISTSTENSSDSSKEEKKPKNTFEFLGFDKGDYHDHNGQLLPNLFTLMVSATPYNFFPHLKPQHILYWNAHLKDFKIENTYQGLSDFRNGTNNCKMKSNFPEMSAWWETNQQYFASMIQNGFTTEFILVLLDYSIAIANVGDLNLSHGLTFPLTTEVEECVEECISQNKQIIVRLERAFDGVRPTQVAKKVLQKVIEVFQQKIEIEVLTSTEKTPQSESTILDDKSKIMLIIDQYRMGDTFPKSCICFDLRARYLFPVKDFTSIIQDVGRAFGYGKRPLLLLSQQASEFLTDIWDPSTGYISWENLKTKLGLKPVLLGENTTRKSQIPTVQTANTIDVSVSVEDGEELEQLAIDFDSTEMVIQQFQEIYDHNPSEPVFLCRKIVTQDFNASQNSNATKDAFAHCIFLKAEPQIGKTGAFLHLAYLIEEKLCKDSFFLREFTNTSYQKKNLDEILEDFKTPKGREKHKKYLRALGRARENRKKNGVVEPSRWAALCLIKNLLENSQKNKAEIQIADFGCGDMQFANFLCEELQKKPELTATKICIHAFDISPNDIPITDQLHSSQQIRIVLQPGVSCGDSTEFQAKSFDYIISTLALFGNEDSWKKTIQTAFCALKTTGIFILAEWDKYLSSKTAQKLLPAGIICNHFAPGIFKL